MTASPLLPIGAFSNATQLSVKALRLYAEQGLLVPAQVDADSGYRYYRADQVQQARLIRLLRELDLPIAQIAQILRDRSAVAVAAKLQMDCLARRHALQQSAYHALLALLASTSRVAGNAVEQRLLPPAQTLVVSFEADLRNLLGRAQVTLDRLLEETGHATVADAAFILLPAAPAEQEEITIELCVPVTQENDRLPAGPRRSWPEAAVASIDVAVKDGVPDLVAASDALFDWFDRLGRELRETPRLYLHSPTPALIWPVS